MTPETKSAPDENKLSPNDSSKQQLGKWLTVGAVIVLCCVPFFRSFNVRDRALEEDEIYWIGQAYYFHLAFEKFAWSHPDWKLLPSRENPALGKYLIGLGLRLNGLRVTKPDWLGVFYIIAKDRPNAWGNEQDRAERLAVIERMDPKTRELAVNQDQFEYPFEFATAARAVMLVFGALSVVAVFALTSLFTGRVAAFVAALAFSLHPAVVAAYTEVGADILAIGFSLLAVIHSVLIQRRIWSRCERPKLCRTLLCISGGISLAFAIGSKMNALVVVMLGVALCCFTLVTWLRWRIPEVKESLLGNVLMLVVCGIVFVAPNPVNYPNPIKGVWSVYADQKRSLDVQKTIPAVRKPLRSLGERVRATASLTALHPAAFLLVVLAFVLCLRKVDQPVPILALWWMFAFLMVTAWLPFARARYVLPVIAPSVILCCAAADGAVKILRRRRAT